MAFLPKLGECLHGFSLLETGHIKMLAADTADFLHHASGARLLWIRNDDRELGFNLIYRTPQLDGTDANHMLEHLVLCSCRKYPSRDIFFDMDSKSYSTFMNGLTDNTFTCYPICSQSEEQLIRLADVFLSCMEQPDALSDPRFFQREGLRLEPTPDGSLAMQGTVLNEDWAHLTDIEEYADQYTAQALYPGQNAAFIPGQAHRHYEEIQFSQVQERFRQFYHYSNCLIVLYGSMDLERMLRFLDEAHLSRFPERDGMPGGTAAQDFGSAALALLQEAPAPGFRELTGQCPAYQGSPLQDASLIDYAIDLGGCTQEELTGWDLLAGMLDSEASVWHRLLREAGIHNITEVYLDTSLARPVLKFHLRNGEASQKERFLDCARQALIHVSRFGVAPELFASAMKENRLSDYLTREAPHLGFHISEEIARCWSQTGRTDSLSLYEQAVCALSRDSQQQCFRRLAASVLSPAVSALIVTVPVPGLAEQQEARREQYLQNLRHTMSETEWNQLKEENQRFQEWSGQEQSSMDFLIQPRELPEPEPEPPFSWRRDGRITFYRSPAPSGQIGCYQLFFDISGISLEDRNYLGLYQLLLTELDTDRFTIAQQKTMEQNYLHDCTFDEFYPDRGPGNFPMMGVLWYSLTEDFAAGLDFLLDIMENADYSNQEAILQAVNKYLPDYDLSRADSGPSLAYSLAEGYIRQDARFRYLMNSPELFPFFQNISRVLTSGTPEERGVITERLRATAASILSGAHIFLLVSAEQDALAHIEETAARLLKRPSPLHASPLRFLPSMPRRAAACIDSPSQEIRMLGDFRSEPAFQGRFLPFLLAAGDKYIKPVVRYQGGAYDSGIDFSLPAGYFTLWSTADPELAATLRIFRDTGKALAGLEISQADLDGYILSAYAQALPVSGPLSRRMRAMRRHLSGVDPSRLNALISDIRRSRLEDQAEAARVIDRLLANGPCSAVGSRSPLRDASQLFDQVMDLTVRPGCGSPAYK